MHLREATDADWAGIWPFLHHIAAAADTFTYDPGIDRESARAMWLAGSRPGERTTVAVDEHGRVLGTAHMHTNRLGPGSHVASASYMVDPEHSGRGVGRRLCEDSLDWAREAGYAAMQFNAVAATNTVALGLYESLGFSLVGTVPAAFDHPRHGRVGLHVLHRFL